MIKVSYVDGMRIEIDLPDIDKIPDWRFDRLGRWALRMTREAVEREKKTAENGREGRK